AAREVVRDRGVPGVHGQDGWRSEAELHGGRGPGDARAVDRAVDWTGTLSSSHDVIVIGAGPAGAAAAVAATECGLSVLVLDEGQAGGGRIHRPPDSWREHSGASRVGAEGRALARELSSCGAELAFEHCVWHV